MKNAFLVLVLVLFSLAIFAQEIQYGDPLKSKVHYSALVGEIDGKLFMSGGGSGKVQMSIVDESLNIILTQPVDLTQNKLDHNVQDFVVFNDELYVLRQLTRRNWTLKSTITGN